MVKGNIEPQPREVQPHEVVRHRTQLVDFAHRLVFRKASRLQVVAEDEPTADKVAGRRALDQGTREAERSA